MKAMTVRETFDRWWKLNPENGCHEWQRPLSPKGYGQLNVGGPIPKSAHRFAWERANGSIVDNLHVLHRCDNPRCVNVQHLFLGTNLDNIKDMHSKGRASGSGLSGERHPEAKLSWDQVLMIRTLCTAGHSQRKIAIQFGISQTHVGGIGRGESWCGDGTKPETRRDYVKPRRLTRRTVADRFDELFERCESGCWLWTAWKSPDGYGRFKFQGTSINAHRFSYERTFGVVPDGMVVRHTCDQRACVNPSHLILGTQAENIRDMVARGRQRGAPGETHPKAKLSDEKVRFIRLAGQSGRTKTEIARAFGVSAGLIGQVLSGRLWRHVA